VPRPVVARQLGYGVVDTVPKWVNQAGVDAGERPGITTEDNAKLRQLEQENRELPRPNEILRSASASSRRSSTAHIGGGEYIDADREEFGVEPICRVPAIAPFPHHSVKSRPLSARAVRDAVLMPIRLALWLANYRVYGGLSKRWCWRVDRSVRITSSCRFAHSAGSIRTEIRIDTELAADPRVPSTPVCRPESPRVAGASTACP
jgi:hypothetical protein